MQISVPSNSLCVSICCKLSAFSLLMIHTAYLKPWVMNSSILRTDISTVGDLSVPWVPIVVVTVFVLSPVGIALPRISTNLSQFSPSQLYRILTVLSFTSHLSVLFPFSVLVISSFHLLQVSMSSSECDVPHPLALLAPLPPLCMTWASTLSYCPGYGQAVQRLHSGAVRLTPWHLVAKPHPLDLVRVQLWSRLLIQDLDFTSSLWRIGSFLPKTQCCSVFRMFLDFISAIHLLSIVLGLRDLMKCFFYLFIESLINNDKQSILPSIQT